MASESLQARIIAALRDGPRTAHELADATGVTYERLRNVVKRLMTEGVVEGAGNGRSARVKGGVLFGGPRKLYRLVITCQTD